MSNGKCFITNFLKGEEGALLTISSNQCVITMHRVGKAKGQSVLVSQQKTVPSNVAATEVIQYPSNSPYLLALFKIRMTTYDCFWPKKWAKVTSVISKLKGLGADMHLLLFPDCDPLCSTGHSCKITAGCLAHICSCLSVKYILLYKTLTTQGISVVYHVGGLKCIVYEGVAVWKTSKT